MARTKDPHAPLTPQEEAVLKVAKEIVVKFIEVGRVSMFRPLKSSVVAQWRFT